MPVGGLRAYTMADYRLSDPYMKFDLICHINSYKLHPKVNYRELAYKDCRSLLFLFFSSRRRHTRLQGDWSSDVCSSDLFSTAATIEALDPNSGQLLWSALLTGTYGYSSAVTAANGVVFSAGYAFDQKTGATVWQLGGNAGDSPPAVTADGMYLTYPCTTIDYRPATGETIWSNNTGCSGGGGGTPVVAN